MRSYAALAGVVLGAMLAILAPLSDAFAQKRLALVIGNEKYEHVTPLQKAAADARAYRDHFETERGFDQVFYAEDADEETMVETIANFIGAISEGDIAVVVYSGHGVQLDQNRTDSLFLLPVDIPELTGTGLSAEFRLSRSAISFSELRDQISLRGASTRVFVLDACRDNPFAASGAGTRSVGITRGLLPIKSVSGEFVFFAAAPGAQALDRLSEDDPNPNSVFSRVFLKHFKRGAFLEDIANDVQSDVFELARTATPAFIQQPYYDDGVIGRTCIDDKCGVTPKVEGGTGNTSTSTIAGAACPPELARELWDFARETNDCLGYDAYLEACPQTTFAAFARAGRARLGCAPASPGAPATASGPATPPVDRTDRDVTIAAAPSEATSGADPSAAPSTGATAALALPSEDVGEDAREAAETEQPAAAAPRMSKYEARRNVLEALSELYRAGIETQYEALHITETEDGVVARLDGLRARIPDMDAEIRLDSISARRDEYGGFIFTLPEKIVMEDLTPIEGAEETAQLIVSSSAMFAGLYKDEEGGHVLKVGGALLKLEPPELTGEAITFKDFTIDGRLATNAGTGEASLSASISVAEALAELEDGGEPIEMRAQDLRLRFDGDNDQAKGVFGLASAGVAGREFGSVGLAGFRVSLDAKPGDRFDFSRALAPDADTEDMIQAVMATVFQKVLEGGHLDTSAWLAQVEANITEVGGEPTTLDAQKLAAKLELNPERIGAGIEAASFDFNMAAPEVVRWEIDNMRADFGAEPGGRFDWSTVAAAPGDSAATWAMVDQIRNEIAAGGRASLILTNDSYDTTTQLPPGGPFSLLRTGGGGNSTEITIERNTAAVAMEGKRFFYESSGGIEGRADVGVFTIDADFPLTAAPRPQQGRASLELRDIIFDERLWAFIDPQNALKHEVNGVSLQTIIVTQIMKDLLTLDGTEQDAPLSVSRVDLSNLSIEALGASASAVGDIMIDPTPVGMVRVTLKNWDTLMTGLAQTPMGSAPESAGALLAATNWVDTYGEPGATPNESILEIKFSEDGRITINGKPFEG